MSLAPGGSAGGGSIRWRLTAGAAVAIALALLLSGLALGLIFERQVTRLAAQELEARSLALVAGFDPGRPPAPPAEGVGGDPRYLQPYSGLYWQVEIGGRTARSQSLWDTVLPLRPAPPATGEVIFHDGAGPDGQRLLILERTIRVGPGAEPVRLAVAMSRASLEEAPALFARGVAPALVVLGLLLIAASAVQVAIGLRAFARIRQQVEELQDGRCRRLGRDMPREVRPLAGAIDALLDDREARIERARHRAAELAHTFKTPLQALRGETARLRAAGQGAMAETIDRNVDTIRAGVDRELGAARIGGEGTADAAEVAARIAAVLRRTLRGEEVALVVEMPAGLQVRIDPYDLTEALGSLAENALRHARSEVRLAAVAADRTVDLRAEDDGPGIPPHLLDRLLHRGEGLDAEGTGLGLALARDVAAAAGGELLLENLPEGFRATLRLARV